MIEALYVHIPFCAKRCSYCDFSTRACNDGALMDKYVEALSLQLRRASRTGLLGAVKTIYIGGGTPSYLGTRRLNSLVYLISLSVNLEHVVEFTVEANPDSLTAPMVRDLYALGVNRFSIGAQSFDDAELSRFGRIHDAEQIKRAVSLVKQRDCDVSLDLICGGPGQTLSSWEASVRAAIALEVQHVSVYPLMLEEGTPLHERVGAGKLQVPDDEFVTTMMQRASEMLEQAGYMRYEVASYALAGHEAKHNIGYWTGVEYLGLGAGASSMMSSGECEACLHAGLFQVPAFAAGEMERCCGDARACGRVRLAASDDVAAYVESGARASCELECLTYRESVFEDLMLGMRRSCGVRDELVSEGASFNPELCGQLVRLRDAGLLCHEAGAWKPTQKGWLLGNEIFAAIWNLA